MMAYYIWFIEQKDTRSRFFDMDRQEYNTLLDEMSMAYTIVPVGELDAVWVASFVFGLYHNTY